MVKSLSDARFTMWATVLPRLISPGQAQPAPGDGVLGHYERSQDPDSGEVLTTFVADPTADPKQNQFAQYEIPCYARSFTTLGYRSEGNLESYHGGVYNVAEMIQFDFPPTVVLNRQSYITNIRIGKDETKNFIWIYEDSQQPVVWQVQGVAHVHDPFGKLIRNTTVLKRAEIQ